MLLTSANTIKPTPYVAPGSTAAVSFGDLQTTGSPAGTGTDVHDVNTSTGDATKQAEPPAMIWAYGMRICNDGVGDLEISFDGTNVHGKIKANEIVAYYRRFEAGISLRGVGGATPTFRVEAW